MNETLEQIRHALRVLSPVLLFAAAVVTITILMVTDAISFDGRRGPDPERMLSRLQDELALSDEQVQQMRPILEEQMATRRSLFQEVEGRGDRSAMREKMIRLRQEADRQLESILTPEQLEAFREMRRQKMRGRRNAMGG
ncbi:Spy/CpxP family protein refolding chaperone [Desulfosarcina alkanivorans]|nr:hypothetical protein [Desulfosarcina alkanivorans]